MQGCWAHAEETHSCTDTHTHKDAHPYIKSKQGETSVLLTNKHGGHRGQD